MTRCDKFLGLTMLVRRESFSAPQLSYWQYTALKKMTGPISTADPRAVIRYIERVPRLRRQRGRAMMSDSNLSYVRLFRLIHL